MTIEKEAEIINEAIRTYGDETQITVAIEEMSELTKELCKVLRVYKEADINDYVNNIIEEMADVEIMLTQLRIIFAIKYEEVSEMMGNKLARLEERMKE